MGYKCPSCLGEHSVVKPVQPMLCCNETKNAVCPAAFWKKRWHLWWDLAGVIKFLGFFVKSVWRPALPGSAACVNGLRQRSTWRWSKLQSPHLPLVRKRAALTSVCGVFVKTPAQMCMGDHRLAGLLTLLHCSLEQRICIKEGIHFLVLLHRYEKEILKGVIITALQWKCCITMFKRERTCN